MPPPRERLRAAQSRLQRHGQSHVLRFWDELSDAQRIALLDDIERIDLDRCAPLIDRLIRAKPAHAESGELQPPAAFADSPTAEQRELYARARAAGEAAIRAGRVAAFTVAGGQGTRLGYDGPKGAFPISPIRQAPLFQLFAEYLRGVERRYGRRVRWYLMTSSGNDAATRAFFQQHDYFGLPHDEVTFFQQAEMPAFTPDGRIALAEKHRVALSPDGHGGSLRALAVSGSLDDMRRRGIDTISYFQVDNPLVRLLDPLFIGLHRLHESEMSSKAVRKADDFERVGIFALRDGKLTVLEYSDLPAELATQRDADGARRFDAGSIAVHVLDRAFVERLTTAGSPVELGWHRAEKKVALLDERGRRIEPDRPNAIKLEQFVFDAIPLARNPLVLYTRREEEFSPVKNAEGADSPATTRRDLLRRAAGWLESAGVRVPRNAEGEPAWPIEISPAFALDSEDLRARLADRRLGSQDGPLLLL